MAPRESGGREAASSLPRPRVPSQEGQVSEQHPWKSVVWKLHLRSLQGVRSAARPPAWVPSALRTRHPPATWGVQAATPQLSSHLPHRGRSLLGSPSPQPRPRSQVTALPCMECHSMSPGRCQLFRQGETQAVWLTAQMPELPRFRSRLHVGTALGAVSRFPNISGPLSLHLEPGLTESSSTEGPRASMA